MQSSASDDPSVEEIAPGFSTALQARRPVISRSGFFYGHFYLQVNRPFPKIPPYRQFPGILGSEKL
jgi:hypothetical protein